MNIYDIAKEAEVSISTVSRVLNNKGNVKYETRIKIEKILKKYNYTPSAIARGLVSKSMKTIGILTIDVRVPHYANTAYIIEQEFSNKGYNVIVCNTGGSMKENMRYIKILKEKQADGIVLIGSIFNEIINYPQILSELKSIPIVLANGKLELSNAYSVLADDAMGITLAMNHLYSKGHKDIVYIKNFNTYSANLKADSFMKNIILSGKNNAHEFVFETDTSLEGGKCAAKKILESDKKFTAVVCGEDITAVGAIKCFKKYGFNIPQDIAVTGFNNSEYAKISNPELTTVENKGNIVGILCSKLLESLILREGEYASLVVQPELIIREST